MTTIHALTAEPRLRAGKGTARQTRRDGRVPAVIYGNKEEAQLISLDAREFGKVYRKAGFLTHLVDLTVAGTTHRVLPRDIQFHPVTDVPLHVDFLRIAADTVVTVEVPWEFINQNLSPGLKRGAVLNVVRFKAELHCRVDAIPEKITVDLAGYDVGASIHISTVKLPEGVTPTISDRDFTIATIVAPSGLRSEEGAEAAAAKA